VDPNNKIEMYKSNEIVEYLDQVYMESSFNKNFGWIALLSLPHFLITFGGISIVKSFNGKIDNIF